MQLMPDSLRRVWEMPVEHAEEPDLPWHLAATEPSGEEKLQLWRKRKPLLGKDE